MKYRALLLMAIGLLTGVSSLAQEDSYLKKLTEGVVQIRKAKASKTVLNQTVLDWSAADSPKLTLMDEVVLDEKNGGTDEGDYKFKVNQVVTYVYDRQNTRMVSKGDYFNGTEKDIFYSAIETNVKKGETVIYRLTGHVGMQEFAFVSFNPSTDFTVTIDNTQASKGENGVQTVKLNRIRKDDIITISITNHSGRNESFVILNHNPQK